jgi:16S rRNA (uracil1498-N3)-methyltransferase
VNLILFQPHEIDRPLPRSDRRAEHILRVLRRAVGDTFDVGLVNGPRGKATLAAAAPDALTLTFTWGASPPPPEPLTLLVGLPRPQTARDILRDATTLGVGALHFVRTEKAEASYAQSTLWSSGEWQRHVIAGAEQAFVTRIPDVTFGRRLDEVLTTLPAAAIHLALDNYESPQPLRDFDASPERHHVLALGAERGWSTHERQLLRTQKFRFVHLGERVLRTETAVIAALSILRAKLGLL